MISRLAFVATTSFAVIALAAATADTNSTVKTDAEPRFKRAAILADDAAAAARPDTAGSLAVFKPDSQRTGSLGDTQMNGFGSPAYWAGYGAGAAATAAAGAAAAGDQTAVVTPEMAMSAGFQSGYGSNGAIGTPQSPYAGYLEKQIASYPVMIYTLNECMPCQRAKQLLATSYPDVRAHFLELSGNEAWQQQLQMDLQYLTGANTFPFIFVCGQYIGGASELFDMHENGQLRRMVNQVGETFDRSTSKCMLQCVNKAPKH